MRAVNDRILVHKGIIPERTIGGIVISAGTSTDAKVKLNVGKVISVGEGIRFSNGDTVSPKVSPGDVIMWEQFVDIAAEVLGENIICVRFEDVTCVLDKEEEYKHWFFDVAEYKKYQDGIDAELSKKKVELMESESRRKVQVKVLCPNTKCNAPKVFATIYEGEEKVCGDCGSIMAPEVKNEKNIPIHYK